MTKRFKGRVAVLGAGGLLGSALIRRFIAEGVEALGLRSAEIDLRTEQPDDWLATHSPAVAIVVAARQAGVAENIAAPADMLEENAAITLNALRALRRAEVPRVLYCASTALYSPDAPQPHTENDLGIGAPDISHLGYSAAKMLGVRLCQAMRAQHRCDATALLLSNLYGPGASFDLVRANVAPAIIRRVEDGRRNNAAEVEIMGDGFATRDLLYVEDAVDAIIAAAGAPGHPDGLLNIAAGRNISIRHLAETAKAVSGYPGELRFNPEKAQGVRNRTVSISRIQGLGWRPRTELRAGLAALLADYRARRAKDEIQ